jgi:F-type H+-transporting ATPase subunit c
MEAVLALTQDMVNAQSLALILAATQIAAAIALLNGVVVTIGQGNVAATAIESIARQPEARGSITSTMFIGLGVSETSGIYGLLIAFILIFAQPAANFFVSLMGM